MRVSEGFHCAALPSVLFCLMEVTMNVATNALRLTGLVLLVCVVGVAWGSQGSDSALRLLDGSEMRNLARGANPVPCKTGMDNGACEDTLARCASKTKADCDFACTACTATGVGECKCRTSKSWNVLTCNQDPNQAGGCGFFFKTGNCTWSDAKGVCECSPGMLTETACDRLMCTSTGAGKCDPQN